MVGLARNRHPGVALLRFPDIIHVKALKPKPFPENPKTIGEHLKRARLLRGLTQKQTAAELRVDETTVLHWEKGRTEPQTKDYPAILSFLGYDPSPAPITLPERMLAFRRARGWTLKQAATALGVNEATWGQWERGDQPIAWKRYRERLEAFLAAGQC